MLQAVISSLTNVYTVVLDESYYSSSTLLDRCIHPIKDLLDNCTTMLSKANLFLPFIFAVVMITEASISDEVSFLKLAFYKRCKKLHSLIV
uniref:DUF4371 domain-containing protein n=1 Tax=Ascaris lumbricoides TaxID=6252 RepID=A0A0M3IHY7_ASCLU